jgi:hypothetical protein
MKTHSKKLQLHSALVVVVSTGLMVGATTLSMFASQQQLNPKIVGRALFRRTVDITPTSNGLAKISVHDDEKASGLTDINAEAVLDRLSVAAGLKAADEALKPIAKTAVPKVPKAKLPVSPGVSTKKF